MQLNGRVRVTSSLQKQVLTLSPLSKDDQGMYQCFATNDWDMAHDNTQLLLGGMLKNYSTYMKCNHFLIMNIIHRYRTRTRILVYRANFTAGSIFIFKMCSIGKSSSTIYLDFRWISYTRIESNFGWSIRNIT